MSTAQNVPVRTAQPLGRLVRSGAVPGAPRDAFGDRLRALARSVNDRLEGIRLDSEFSPKERRAAVEAILREAKTQAARLQVEAGQALERVDQLVYQVKSGIGRHELSMSPLAVERVRRLADRLGTIDEAERERLFHRAVEQRDSDSLLALGLADPLDNRPSLALAALHAPAEFARLTELAGPTLAGVSAAANLVAGIDDLAATSDPTNIVDNAAQVGDLLLVGNEPTAITALPHDRVQATWTWPGWAQAMAQSHAVQAASVPPPAPEQEPADRQGTIQ